MITLAIVLLFGSFVLSTALTGIVAAISTRRGFVAHPARDRYHTVTVALGGGIAIFATLALFMLAAILVVRYGTGTALLDRFGQAVTVHIPGFLGKIPQLLIVLALVTTLFVLGLVDDIKHLGPFFKLAVQFIVAFIAAIAADIRIELFIESRVITSLMSAFWIVLICNAFNFLDNMDGLSAGMAAIATSILFVAAALSGQVFVGALALLFVGTLLGFLVWNFPPARIFMGDAGSLVVGFFVAVLTLRTTYYHEGLNGQWYAVLMPLIAMAVPLYDFISVTLLRISQGRSPFVGDTQHFSHRMKRRGLTDTQTVLTLYLATLCTGVSAVFLYQVNLIGAVLIFAQTVMILVIIAVFESTGGNDRN